MHNFVPLFVLLNSAKRQCTLMIKILGSDSLHLNPSSDTYYQYDLGKVNFSLPQFSNLQCGASNSA